MSKDDSFNGEDYVTIDGGIIDSGNDYPSSNNDDCGSHHEEIRGNDLSFNNPTVVEAAYASRGSEAISAWLSREKKGNFFGKLFSQNVNISNRPEVIQQNELARQQEAQRVKEKKEVLEKQKAKNAPSAYELTPQYQEHQRKIAEAWSDMHKRLALEKDVIHPQEDRIEFAEQQLRIGQTVQELDGLKLNQPKHNAPEDEVHRSEITTALEQYKNDSNGFHRQIISDGIPIQALHTLSLKNANSVDSRVVDLVFDLLRDNHLPGLKTLDLSGNPRSIGAHQIDKLADSFYSGNNKLESLDISYAYTPRTDLRAKLPNTPVLKERLVKDLYSSGGGNELVKLIHSVALCNQPLCLTLEAGVLIQSSNPPEFILYTVYSLFRKMNWMGEPESFKTTGVEMLNHIRQVFERAYQLPEKEQLAPPQMYNIGVQYKLPHLIDTFTWGITKCLTPNAFSSEDLGGLKDKLTIPYINMNKVYDVMQFTKTKLDTFLCVTEVVGDRIITHDMLNHQAEWKDAFPTDGYFNKSVPNNLGQYKVTKQQISEGEGNNQPFDFSCKHCKESQFAYFLNTQSILQKNDITTMISLNLSRGNLGDGDARIMAKLLKQGSLPNLKSLDVSDNQITPTGEGYFAKAMQNSTVQDMYVTLKNAVGTKKDYYGSFLKQVLKDAQNNGVDIKNIVVDKSLISSIKDNLIMGKKMVFSFIKCKLVPEIEAPSLAKDLFVFTYPKHMVTKILNPIDTVTCVFEATQESFNSDLGAKIAVRDLELMGMDDFIYTLE